MAISSNGDKYFSNVSLLLPFDGANGSTTFYDASPVPKAVTTVGNTNISTTQSKFGGGSAYFDGSDYLSVPYSSDFVFDALDFTIECWVYITALPASNADIFTTNGMVDNGPGSKNGTGIRLDSAGLISFIWNIGTSGTNNGNSAYSTSPLSLNTWYHLAGVRSGTNTYIFVNGVLSGSAVCGPGSQNNTFAGPSLGYNPTNSSWYYTGYIDSARITKGLARYTASFTPPTAPFPTDWEDVPDPYYDNVVLHLPMDGPENGTTFVDRSKTPKTVTTFGNTKLLATQSKFGGRSSYFDGSGDYLTVPASTDFNFPSDFTIEFYVYLSAYSASFNGAYGAAIAARYNGFAGADKGWQVRINGTASSYDTLNIYTGVTDLYLSASFNLNTWYHVAIARSGSSLRAFVNGVQVGATITNSDLFTQSTQNPLYIGRLNDSSYIFYLNGYIDSLRITKGVASYTSNFTVPTGPFAIGKPYVADPYASNVKLLLTGSGANGTQAFRDESGLNNVITVAGNTVIDRNSGRVGGGSIYFDGTGDYLESPYSTTWNLAGQIFTIEAWVYTGSTSQQAICATISRAGAGDTVDAGWDFELITQKLRFGFHGGSGGTFTSLISTNTYSLNTWVHVAVVCEGSGVYKLYLNGVQDGSLTNTGLADNSKPLRVGATNDSGYISYFNGYIDSLRITKGTARYTANFTPDYSYLLPPVEIASTIYTEYTGDKYFGNVKLLLLFDGTSTVANNLTYFNDASSNPKTITTIGNTSISTTQSKFGGGSAYFDGTGDYIALASSADFDCSSGDYTTEFWMYPTAFATWTRLIMFGTNNNVESLAFNLMGSGSTARLDVSVPFSSVTDYASTTSSFTLNEWQHVAVVFVGNTANVYRNGVNITTDAIFTRPTAGNKALNIGIDASVGTGFGMSYYTGYIDSLRISKGFARYTSNFTPPSLPFPADWEDVPDEYYDNVVLHLPMDGPEDGTTFFDRSKTPKTITVTGNTKLLAAQSKFGGRSCYFDGSGDYLTAPNSSEFHLSNLDFTIECWLYCTRTYPRAGSVFDFIVTRDNIGVSRGWSIAITGATGYIAGAIWSDNSTVYSVSSTTVVPTNQWVHVAFVRNNNTLYLYLNGTSVGTPLSVTGISCQDGNINLAIGTNYTGGIPNPNPGVWEYQGYIDSLRITKGVARYTSNFTVPTGPFAIGKPYVADPYASNVKLLLTGSGAHGTSYFKDQSSLKNQISIPLQATLPTVDRVNSKVNGGSFYTGGYMSVPNTNSIFDLVGQDWTIEFWIKPTSAGGQIISRRTTSVFCPYEIALNASQNPVIYIANAGDAGWAYLQTFGGETVPLNTWSHLAFCGSGNTIYVCVNGVKSSPLNSNILSSSNAPLIIGRGGDGTFTGYISNLKFTKGIARYTANFTPEYSYLITPSVVIGAENLYDKTVLTLQFNGNYVDISPVNNTVTAYGNSSLSTSTYKYGTGSLSLDGSGDYIATADSANFRFGTGDFCMECWVYPTMTSFADINCIFDHKTGSPSGWYLYLNWQGKVELYNSSSYLTGNTALTKDVWTHIAVTRSSGSVTIWVNGVADCTPSSGGINTDYTGATTYFGIGALINQRDSRYDFKGYIDNVRITKGAARYTTTFTPSDFESSSVIGPVRAYSEQSITSNGAVKFTIPVAGVIQAGFSTNASTDITKSDLEYSIQIDSSKILTVVESGTVKSTLGTASDGTNFEIEYSGTTMIYKANGAQLLTTTVSAGMTLYFSAFIEDVGLYVTGIQIGTYATDGTPGNISGQITANNISTYIAGGAIDTAYIKDLAVTTAKLANLAVTTGKINDLAVETSKIAINSVSKVYAASGGTIFADALASINNPLVELTNIIVPSNSTGVVIMFNATYYNNTASTRAYSEYKLYRDNLVITDITGYDSTFFSINVSAGDYTTISKVFVDNAVTAGTHSYQMKPLYSGWLNSQDWTINAAGNLSLRDITLYAITLLR